ncbi:MAG TPA: CDP-alcohol phosphatidyltransferase family protein [bacterium]|nr:CDP-alcohol phosphatidyltransferase family protein [bacterium]
MATDFIDGAIARACGLVSETGKWLDPLADKIVYLPILTYFAWIGWIESPVWLVLLALADFVGTVARPWLTAAATMWGKAKTCLAFGFVGWMVCWRDARFWPDADYVTAFGGMNEGIGWTLALLAVASVVSKIPFRRKGES